MPSNKNITVLMVLAAFFVGGFAGVTSGVRSDLSWALSPTAIIISACVAIFIAKNNIENNANQGKENRTIEYISSRFPPSQKLLNTLTSAEQKVVNASNRLIAKRYSREQYGIDLDRLQDVVDSLSPDEYHAICEVGAYFETILTNINSGYFSEEIVEIHLGSNFALRFWARSWPVLVHAKHVDFLYGELKGIPKDKNGGPYAKLERYILKNGEIKNPYPMFNETFFAAPC